MADQQVRRRRVSPRGAVSDDAAGPSRDRRRGALGDRPAHARRRARAQCALRPVQDRHVLRGAACAACGDRHLAPKHRVRPDAGTDLPAGMACRFRRAGRDCGVRTCRHAAAPFHRDAALSDQRAGAVGVLADRAPLHVDPNGAVARIPRAAVSCRGKLHHGTLGGSCGLSMLRGLHREVQTVETYRSDHRDSWQK